MAMRSSSVTRFFNRYYYDANVASLGIRLLGCGHYSRHMFKPMREPRTLACYGLVYLLEGQGRFASAHVPEREVKSGDVLLLFPGEWHQYNPLPDSEWHEYWFIFEGETVDFLAHRGHLNPMQAVLQLPSGSALSQVASESLSKVCSGLSRQLITLPGSVFSMLNLLEQARMPASREHDAIHTLIQRIQTAPLQPWDFYQIAGKLGMSYHTLRKKILSATGLPPHRLVNSLCIQLSCQYLLQGMTVQEVAAQIGMPDPYYYSRLFKSIIGQSPRAFAQGMEVNRRAAALQKS